MLYLYWLNNEYIIVIEETIHPAFPFVFIVSPRKSYKYIIKNKSAFMQILKIFKKIAFRYGNLISYFINLRFTLGTLQF